jgi:MFS-type transporter involved in bile tolerance (Atg22 family)
LISYHFKIHSLVKDYQIPLFYAGAMLVDAGVALLIGKTYDKIGLRALLAVPVLTAPVAFFGFSHSYGFILASVLLWGAVMGVHETIMRAAIADIVEIGKRGFAYGIFNTIYGASWFFGGAAMGLLYGISIKYVIIFAIFMQILAIILFFSKVGRQNTQ